MANSAPVEPPVAPGRLPPRLGYPVVLRDCVTSSRRDLHDAALLVMSARYDVITAEEFIGLI